MLPGLPQADCLGHRSTQASALQRHSCSPLLVALARWLRCATLPLSASYLLSLPQALLLVLERCGQLQRHPRYPTAESSHCGSTQRSPVAAAGKLHHGSALGQLPHTWPQLRPCPTGFDLYCWAQVLQLLRQAWLSGMRSQRKSDLGVAGATGGLCRQCNRGCAEDVRAKPNHRQLITQHSEGKRKRRCT